MVWIDRSQVRKANTPEMVPDGQYSVRVANAVAKNTRTGDEVWHLTLFITEGPFTGYVIYDDWVFNAKGLPKVLAAFKAAGDVVVGDRDYCPYEICHCKFQITTYVEKWEDSEGVIRSLNKIPLDGYTSLRRTRRR